MAEYTPTSSFEFSLGSYTPSTTFDFTTGPASENIGDVAATLDDAVGAFFGSIPVQGDITASLDDVTGAFVGDIWLAGIIGGQLDDAVGDFTGNQYQNLGVINATLDDVVGGAIGNYDPNVTRWITRRTNAAWDDVTAAITSKAIMARDQSARTDHKAAAAQEQAEAATSQTRMHTEQGSAAKIAQHSTQVDATGLLPKTRMHRDQGAKTNTGDILMVQDRGTRADNETTSVKQQMTKVYPDKWTVNIQDSGVVQHDFLRLVYLEPPEEYRYTPGVAFAFNPGSYTPEGAYEWLYGETAYLATGHNFGVTRASFDSTWNKAAVFNEHRNCSIIQEARKPPRGKTPWVDIPRPEPNPDPPSGNTHEIPTREVYTMNFNVSVTLEDLTEIDVDEVVLEYDADSFAWKFSAVLLDDAQLPLIKPLPDGSAVTLVVTLNGYVWHVLVESLPHKRQFAKSNTTITGRGLSARLAAPYYQATTGLQGSLLAIEQLAALHVPAGWTLNWQTVTWNVPGGAYSYQNRTPIQAIADIALAAGAIVRPSRDSQALDIIPRYPVLPWDFAGSAVDVAVPEDVVLEVTHRDTSRQYANGVYVHGAEIGGEIGFCRLNGTAGDVLLQTYTNPLMTDVVGLRAQGERLLAAEYTQPEISSFKVPMDGVDVPLMEVGTFVGVTIDSVETRGVVNGVKITASRARVEISQELRLGEDTNNQWIAFQSLLPADPLLLGTLQSIAGGIATMQLIDGGVMNVRGTGTVGQKYYIRSGQIQGDAPSMTQSEIVI